ncbi:MAG: hypothetical protein WB816_01805 [Methylocystis sp.]
MLEKIIAEFSEVSELPIEITEVRQAILRNGVQDRIVFCPDEAMDQTKLIGAYYQYTRRDGLYGDTELVSIIVFCSKLEVSWQRMICCKEMVHILDDDAEKTDTLEELDGLLTRLLGPLSTGDFNIFDIMATKDRLALYQAIPLLFPMTARNNAVEKLKRGECSVADIAEAAVMPKQLIEIALRDEWPRLLRDLTC